jgi:multiple sugar transport system permease protein
MAVRDLRMSLKRARLAGPRTSLARREARMGYLFIAPWIVGFLAFQAGPILASLGLSLTEWTLLRPPVFAGLANYRRLAADPLFFRSMRVTLTYTAASVPLGILFSLVLALLLNQKVRGISVFRALFYLPSVVAGVGVAILWGWMFNPSFGVINYLLGIAHIPGPDWLASPQWALPSFIILSLWGVGGSVVIFLAALQGVPIALYEAAALDGAGAWARFRHVTVPMISPIILFNTVLGVIGSFQTFTYAYVLTGGGPNYATLFYVLYLYQNAFRWFEMGYASALAWVLFLMIISCTLLIMRLSRSHVHYEGAQRDNQT